MAFCSHCGVYIADGSQFCPACGRRLAVAPGLGEKKSAPNAGAAAQTAPEPEPEAKTKGAERDTGQSGGYEDQKGSYHYTYHYASGARPGSASDAGSQRREEAEGGGRGTYDARGNARSTRNARSAGPGGWVASEGEYGDPYDVRKNRGLAYLCYLGVLFVIPYFTRPESAFIRFHSNQGLLLLLSAGVVSVSAAIPLIGWLFGLVGWIAVLGLFFSGISSVKHGRMRELPVIGGLRLLR